VKLWVKQKKKRRVTTRSYLEMESDDVKSKISNRILNEVKGVVAVAHHITTKPPGTIESQ
jgi:GMP synthase PP-ATPase subunit